jgi:hypothetical protein
MDLKMIEKAIMNLAAGESVRFSYSSQREKDQLLLIRSRLLAQCASRS